MDNPEIDTRPTLRILTDAKDHGWLRYILDEFSTIQGAKFQIQITELEPVPDEGNQIFYCVEERPGAWIPQDEGQRQFSVSAAESILSSKQIDQDIFRLCFTALSRIEEYDSELGGKKIRSYKQRHPDKDPRRFKKPYVNLLFAALEGFITRRFPLLEFEGTKKPIVEIGHDLDYIEKTIQLRLKQGAFHAYNTARSILHPSGFIPSLQRSLRFLFASTSYWCFDYWMEFEKQHDCRSTFYLFSDTNQGGLRPWLMDPSYDIHSHRELQEQMKAMHSEGFEIGLHGSFNSATDKALLKKEKTRLEETLGTDILKTRQHWLNFEEQHTPAAHSELFAIDATLAWNDDIGFRAGCASQFHPYDHENGRAFRHLETPQVIMDSNLYDYAATGPQKKLEEATSLLNDLGGLKNVRVGISWHPRVCSKDYNWHPGYEELVRMSR